VEGATVAPSRHAVDQFRLHLLERVPDAARVKLRGISAMEAASGNGLRELWEKSDLPAGIFADEVAGFWKLPRLGLQELMNAIGAVEQFSPRFLRESSVFLSVRGMTALAWRFRTRPTALRSGQRRSSAVGPS